MQLFKNKNQAFTLVELIVVVTILAILGTIGFVSYSSYLSGVRDANRTASLGAISDGLSLYTTRGPLPIPDLPIGITTDGTTLTRVGYQGYAGTTVLEIIDYSKGGLDPADNVPFTYYVSRDRRDHQLMAFLEESDGLQASNLLFSQANAVDLTARYPTVYGRQLGIIVDENNNPIQEDSVIQSAGLFDLSNASTVTYKAYLKDGVDPIDGADLLSASPYASCKRIFESSSNRSNGIYTINPTGAQELEVYCDMTTDGGGWTLVFKNDGDSDNGNLVNNRNIGNGYNIENLLTDDYLNTGTFSDVLINAIMMTQYKILPSNGDSMYVKITEGVYDGSSELPTKLVSCTYDAEANYNTSLSSTEWNKGFSTYGTTPVGIIVDLNARDASRFGGFNTGVFCGGSPRGDGVQTKVFVR